MINPFLVSHIPENNSPQGRPKVAKYAIIS